MKYQRNPVIVDAIQYTGYNDDEVILFTNGMARIKSTIPFSPDAPTRDRGYVLAIPTKEGEMVCSINDYIIKEPFPSDDRQFYPCKQEIFEETYSKIQ